MVLEGFGHLVRGFFSLFSAIPGNPLVLAEIFATNLVGVLFVVGFIEIKKENRSVSYSAVEDGYG